MVCFCLKLSATIAATVLNLWCGILAGVPVLTKVPSSLATPTEGSDFQETCQAKGYPIPKLSWLRLGMPLPARRTEVKSGNLTIRKVRLSDGGAYECAASNSMGTKKARISLAVQRNPVMKGNVHNTGIILCYTWLAIQRILIWKLISTKRLSSITFETSTCNWATSPRTTLAWTLQNFQIESFVPPLLRLKLAL